MLAGHFGFAKTLVCLDGIYWKEKSRDVKSYCVECITCQQQKDFADQRLNNPMFLELPQRRWGLVSTDFILSLPKTERAMMWWHGWIDFLDGYILFRTNVGYQNRCCWNIFLYASTPTWSSQCDYLRKRSEIYKLFLERVDATLWSRANNFGRTSPLDEWGIWGDESEDWKLSSVLLRILTEGPGFTSFSCSLFLQFFNLGWFGHVGIWSRLGMEASRF